MFTFDDVIIAPQPSHPCNAWNALSSSRECYEEMAAMIDIFTEELAITTTNTEARLDAFSAMIEDRMRNSVFFTLRHCSRQSLIARFMGPTWGPSGADRTQVDPRFAPWTLLSGSDPALSRGLTTFETCRVLTIPIYLLCKWKRFLLQCGDMQRSDSWTRGYQPSFQRPIYWCIP